MTVPSEKEIVAITGSGGMGIACARRLGPGRRLILADFDERRLQTAVEDLARDGHDVGAHRLDVSDRQAVELFAATCAAAGHLRTIVHTAGLSSAMAPAARIYAVNLVGTANMLDAFLPHVLPGTVAIMIASILGRMHALPAETERRLATAPAADLIAATGMPRDTIDGATAYTVSKRGCILRIEAAAPAWGDRGARLVSVSPGFVHTPMGRLAKETNTAAIDRLIQAAPAGRVGTAEDIAAAVAWLASPAASYITGTDLLIDGGALASHRWRGPAYTVGSP